MSNAGKLYEPNQNQNGWVRPRFGFALLRSRNKLALAQNALTEKSRGSNLLISERKNAGF